LAFAEFGPSGVVYPPGPDGARDFTLEGRIPKFESRDWNGYLVLQAKFKDRLETPEKDLAWLRKQIDGELRKFLNTQRKLRRPEYYILATNVRLSGADSVEKMGGYSKTIEFFDPWRTELGLRDVHLLPADVIIDLLANHQEIRMTYAAWVTSGDVLAAAIKQLAKVQPSFERAIRRALKRRIYVDQYVPLNEAGSVTTKRLETSKVFIDLRVSRPVQSAKNTLFGDQGRQIEPDGFVATLSHIARACFKTDPDIRDQNPQEPRFRTYRIVLLGGPGQGKSTTGLFAVQLFRAALLRDDPTLKADPAVEEVVTNIIGRATAQNLSVQVPRRFPVHISLPAYADLVSSSKRGGASIPTLLTYIATEIVGVAADSHVDREDLRLWLEGYPWLLVFDGLDEVPPSGERPAVLDAINGFLSECAEADADVLVVVTSRPQGYNKDFDERYWDHWHLADLPPESAVEYSDALSQAQYPHEPDRQQRIRQGIERAMRQPATARLLVSPLQVTIMHLIVDGGGSAPIGRWSLFNEYYQVLKKERGKGGETQEVLERHWEHLDPIHFRAGLLLQVESELPGGADAHLTPQRLRELIAAYLKCCGYSHVQQESLANELAALALRRLVLLSMRQEEEHEDKGRVVFDVRSLQEFMAAAQLTTEREPNHDAPKLEVKNLTIEERLTHLADKTHWRHAFLIAASRCFSDTAFYYLRSAVVSIPRGLDGRDPDRLIRNGARLAIEMLSDGIGSSHPLSRQKLLDHAFEIMDLGPAGFDERLISLCDEENEGLIDDQIRRRLSDRGSPGALAAWKLVSALALKGSRSSRSAILEFWPADPKEVLLILQNVGLPLLATEPECDIMKALSACPLRKVLDVARRVIHDRSIAPQPRARLHENLAASPTLMMFTQLAKIVGRPSDRPGELRIKLGEKLEFETSKIISLNSEELKLLAAGVKGWEGGWRGVFAAGEFLARPSAEILSKCLLTLARPDVFPDVKDLSHIFPWPIATLLSSALNMDAVEEFAKRAAGGDFGDCEDWTKAELRWNAVGIVREDLLDGSDLSPFSRDIGARGAPHFTSLWFMRSTSMRIAGAELVSLWKASKNTSLRNAIARSLFRAVSFGTDDFAIPTEELMGMIKGAHSQIFSTIPFLPILDSSVWDKPEAVEQCCELLLLNRGMWSYRRPLPLQPMIKAFCNNPALRMLLEPIALGLAPMASEQGTPYLELLGSEAFEWQESDRERTKAAVAVLRLIRFGDISTAVSDAIAQSIRSGEWQQLAHLVADCKMLSQVSKEKVLTAVARRPEFRGHRRADLLIEPLKSVLGARKSELFDPDLWMTQLGLPADTFPLLKRYD
jgi:hypothetical protein